MNKKAPAKNEKSGFARSVEDFSSKELPKNQSANRSPDIKSLIMRCIMIALCIAVFGYSVFMIADRAIDTKHNNDLYDSVRPENSSSEVRKDIPMLEPNPMFTLEQMVDSNGNYPNYIGDEDAVSDPERRQKYFRNFKHFASKHKDAYAWIYVTNTKIDYPVMKGETNELYLTHDFNGNKSSAGSIFADYYLSDNFEDNINNVIYGHCMKNGSMFRTLKTFMESANRYTLAKTMTIEIYAPNGLYIFKPISGYRDNSAHFINNSFSSPEEVLSFLEEIKAKDTLRLKKDFDEHSKICTLVTCANARQDDTLRYVLHGILTSFIPASQLG